MYYKKKFMSACVNSSCIVRFFILCFEARFDQLLFPISLGFAVSDVHMLSAACAVRSFFSFSDVFVGLILIRRIYCVTLVVMLDLAHSI
jgi:hypothetical protein